MSYDNNLKKLYKTFLLLYYLTLKKKKKNLVKINLKLNNL